MKGKQLGILLLVLVIIAGAFGYAFIGFGNDESLKPLSSKLNLGLDIKGGVFVVFTVDTPAQGEQKRILINKTIEVLRNRIDSLGLTEPNIYPEGEDRIRVELPGVSDSGEALKVIGRTAKMVFAQLNNGENAKIGDKFDSTKMKALFTGEGVQDAQAVVQQMPVANVVSLKLNSEATKIFAEATAESVKFSSGLGTNGQIAILLDDVVISAPSVNSVISNGESVIQGQMSYEQAQELALLIRSGALPVNLIEERSSLKGPTLGMGALELSVRAAIIGIVLVMLFMIIIYKLPGIMASLALILYSAIIVILMVLMNATLTLPGVLGIVLSIGMAVDANVIIFEKLKEELGEGKSLKAAVSHGFSKALTAIVDSNFTTFIAALVLFNFGEGPIKGFAVTLMLGILTSMFTAIFITRTLLIQFSSSSAFKNKKLYTGTVSLNTNIDFIGKKKLWFGISSVIIVAGLIMFLFTGGFNFGIDFTGGTLMQIELPERQDSAEIKDLLKETDYDFSVTYEGDKLNLLNLMTKKSLGVEDRNKVFGILQEKYNLDNSAMLLSDQFGPKVGGEIQGKALQAIILSAIGMLIYIAIRFELKFSLSAILALIHDIFILLAIYAIFRIPVNSAFIAAILTVVGYSINDTIVIFDRIREEEKYSSTSNSLKIANISLNSTLMRSINTSVTTLLVVVALMIFSVSAIRELALPLMAGILAGTYSSIFIASPIWVSLKQRFSAKKK